MNAAVFATAYRRDPGGGRSGQRRGLHRKRRHLRRRDDGADRRDLRRARSGAGQALHRVPRRLPVFRGPLRHPRRRQRLAAEGEAPSAARVAEIRDRVRDEGVVCAFTEPQFEPKLLQTVIEGTDVRTGVLDPDVGADLDPWPRSLSRAAAQPRDQPRRPASRLEARAALPGRDKMASAHGPAVALKSRRSGKP